MWHIYLISNLLDKINNTQSHVLLIDIRGIKIIQFLIKLLILLSEQYYTIDYKTIVRYTVFSHYFMFF